jgi:hypothetical protein
MSLETAIRENTAALQALTAALSTGTPVSTQRGQEQKVDKPVTPAAASISALAKMDLDPSAPGYTPALPPEVIPLDYARDVKPTVLKLAAQSRDALLAILAKYGAEKGPQVKPEDLAAFFADVQAAL